MMRYMTVAAIAAMAFAAPSGAQQVRFEDPKPDVAKQEEGVKLDFGAAFTQTFQSLGHSNTALEVLDPDGANRNALADIGAGFNLASANIALNARLAPGINVVLETYLSSRHHNDAWVKGGYLQMDASPLEVPLLETIMRYTTIKVGHYEVNYGDAHYRRSDNANGIANPFAENLILDAFTTEIGGEVIVRKGALLGVFGVTSGQNNGTVTNPDDRSLAFLGKVGFDKPFGNDARVRLTASTYQNDNAGRATLYWGDRAGGAYWGVLDNGDQAQHWNGRVNPSFTESIQAYQVNPFVELGPVELFGVIERARGRTLQESEDREVRQYALDAVYRLWEDRVYVAGRYNTVSGELFSRDDEQTVDRAVVSAGWFVTPNVLLKGEYVKQNYDGFAATSILNGGAFDGLVVQGVVGF